MHARMNPKATAQTQLHTDTDTHTNTHTDTHTHTRRETHRQRDVAVLILLQGEFVTVLLVLGWVSQVEVEGLKVQGRALR